MKQSDLLPLFSPPGVNQHPPCTTHDGRFRRVARLAFGLAALLVAAPLPAQAPGSVSGTVVVEGAQRPLPGVQVSVEGQPGKEATTDASGRFRITDITGTTVTLNARALGFRPASQSVTASR